MAFHFRAALHPLGSLLFAAVFAIGLLGTPAKAGEELLFGPPPAWVTDFRAPAGPVATTEATADLPVIARMSDFQTRLEPDRVTHFVSFDLEFLQPDGLSSGDLSMSWRPEFDDLTVHHVLIERGGQVIDVLAEGQTFTVLRREQNLEAATLNGLLTANLFPSGLEVGDVLRLAYSVSSVNPVLAGRPETSFGPLNGIVGVSQVQLSWPESLPITLKSSPDLPAPVRRRRGGWETATLTMRLADPLVAPNGAPTRYQLVRMFEASPYANWGEVSELFVPLYRAASQIPDDGPLRAALEEIRAASSDPVVRAERALALVQDRVRYVALAMGEGGLVPADAATTWARRFGDCKAKTALLLGLLRELGIEGEPVLVSTDLGDALPGRLPQVNAFDHVLVRARIDGREVFLDGTRRGDTSLARITVPHFTWGLPVISGGANLVPMLAAPLETPDEETVVRIDASGGLRVPAPVEAEVILRGDAGINANNAMAQYVGQSRQQALEQYWRDRYDFITPQRVAMRFDPTTGEARITLTGTAELDWGAGAYEPADMRVGYSPDFSRTPGPGSDAPFAVLYPFHDRATHILTLPPGFSAQHIEGEEVDETAGGLEYRRELSLENNVFTGVRTIRSIVPELPIADVPAAEIALERLWDKRVFLNVPPNYRPSREEISALRQSESQNPSQLIDSGLALLEAGQYSAAKDLLDRAIALAPRDEWAVGNRALVNVYLGNLDAAEADIARTQQLSADNVVALHAKGLLAERRNRPADAIAAYTEALAIDPDDGWAIEKRLYIHMDSENFEAALADGKLYAEMSPDNIAGYAAQMFALARLSRLDELDALIASTRSRFPDNRELTATISQVMLAANQEDRSAALLAESLASGPTAQSLFASAQRREIGETEIKLNELNQALQLDPEFLPALALRGQTLWMESRLSAALADANRVIELAPLATEGYDLKAKVLRDLNRRAEAIATIDAMLAALPEDPQVLGLAAYHLAQLGRLTRARELVTQARLIDPADEQLQALQRAIASAGR